ncbi:MAG: hypothetical protein ABSC88_09485 [Terracidiphilus sp.]|jgi:hypothetical protein
MTNNLKRRIDDWLADPTVFLIVVTCLVVAAGIVLSEIQPRIGYWTLLIVVGIILAVFAIAVLMISLPLRREMQQTLEKISSFINPQSIEWLLNTKQLTTYEEGVNADEIWLLSSDLLDDSEGGPFEGVVSANLAKGTRYVYFVPDVHEVRARVEILKSTHKNNAKLRFVYLPDSFFFLVPKLDIAIYNPLSHDKGGRNAFIGLPDPVGTSHYHARASIDFVDRLVGVLLNQYKEKTDSDSGRR